MRIGIDVMGGDFYPHAPVAGAVQARALWGHDVQLVLIGDADVIRAELIHVPLARSNTCVPLMLPEL